MTTRPPAPAPAGLAHRPPPRPTLAVTKVYPPVPPMPADVLVHPTANLMPMMTPQEFADLVERIKAHGLREPIKRLAGPHAGQWLGAIYDGRNRYLACLAAGREPIYEDYQWDGEQSLVELVLDLGVPRRSLTAAQKVIIAEDMKPLLEAEAAERRARGLLRAQQLRAQHGDGPSPSAQVHQGAAAQNDVVEAQDDGEIHGGSPAQKRKRDEGGRTTAKLAKAAQVGEVSVKDVTRILNQAPDLRPVLKLKGPLSIPQARTLATKFTAEDRAVAVDRILAGEKAAAVLADMTPFSAADPALLTAKESSAARVLRGLSQERQQLVLAEGKVDAQALAGPSPAGAKSATLLDRLLSDPKTAVDWRAVGVREARRARPNLAAQAPSEEEVDSIVAAVAANRWGRLEAPSEAVAAIREGVRAELCGGALLTSGMLEGAQGHRAPKAASPEAARPQVLAELPWVLLWSHEKKMWWAANSMGYTNKLAEAGLFTPADATERAHGSSVVVPLTGKPPRPPKKGDKKTTHVEAARRAQAIRDEEGERPPRIRR